MTPREFLGRELCRARVAAGFSSQQALADHLGFERTTVAKAESGDRVPSDPVLAAWAKACSIDIEHYQRLADLARTSDGPVPAWFEYWLERERAAHLLRYWQPVIVTPIFQIAGYARALLLAAQTDTSDEAINPLVEAKLDRADPPDVVALIDELVLHRLIGSPEIMHEQLIRIAELAERPYVCAQVVPTEVGATAGLSGDINLASGDSEPEVLHTDAVPEGHTTESRSLVRKAAVAFERTRGHADTRTRGHADTRTRGHAMPRGQSRDLILEAAKERWKQ
jgi:transcriptional regulator with XRE-family HTH domain